MITGSSISSPCPRVLVDGCEDQPVARAVRRPASATFSPTRRRHEVRTPINCGPIQEHREVAEPMYAEGT